MNTSTEHTAVQVRHAFRLAKQDDMGEYTEFVCFDNQGHHVTVTPESDPAEFARLTALEQANAPAE